MRTKVSECNGKQAEIDQLERMIKVSDDAGMINVFKSEIENRKAEIEAIKKMSDEEFAQKFPEFDHFNIEEEMRRRQEMQN